MYNSTKFHNCGIYLTDLGGGSLSAPYLTLEHGALIQKTALKSINPLTDVLLKN